ncbi:hypothetical protein L596_020574 [Steinernema carpocapsae]|uniref:Uncharacterized protein n=1 Tax=Steinernema carpocapsae TaxID=34508 RepID=A0A4U5MTY4_STECR|nr:hypothetical protein L596_020574 [Steinernema carpocapsae]
MATIYSTPKRPKNKLIDVEHWIGKVNEQVEKYTEDFAQLEESEQSKEQEEYEKRSDLVIESIGKANEIILDLKKTRRALEIKRASSQTISSPAAPNQTTGSVGSSAASVPDNKQTAPGQAQSMLPTIPLPTFSGNEWEWDCFEQLFNSQVVPRCRDDMERFHHL